MCEKTFLGIIPARYASTRFPGKPLVEIGGKPMIQRVYEQAKQVLKYVVVATDDERIYNCVKGFGGKVVMTSAEHRSGTDRCYEAMTLQPMAYDVVINIQGDEPFIHPEQIKALMHCFENAQTDIATLVRRFDDATTFAELSNPNTPKVVFDSNNHALLFSRSVIPYQRGVEPELWASHYPYHAHVGIYAYRSQVLKAITTLPASSLEVAESLEQLRWLEHGYCIQVAETNHPSYGIDTPEDLEKLLQHLPI